MPGESPPLSQHGPSPRRPARSALAVEGVDPAGTAALLVAEPGTGKSCLALDLAQRIAAGTTWPGRTLFVDAEDTPQVFKQRLAAWSEEERRKLYYLHPDSEQMMLNLSDVRDRDQFLGVVHDARPSLIVLDSYGSATLRGENNKEDVQFLLSFLSSVAVDYNCAVMVIRHLRKKNQAQTSLPAMARNILGMQRMAYGGKVDRNSPRTLQVIKSNLGRYPDPTGIYFESHPDDQEVALLRCGDPPVSAQEPSKADECAEWLLELLEDRGHCRRQRSSNWASMTTIQSGQSIEHANSSPIEL